MPISDRPIPRYKLPAIVKACRDLGIPYTFGGKWNPLADPLPPHSGVDCSGFVRGAIYHASLAVPGHAGYPLILPEGSENQHAWAIHALKPCTIADGLKADGIVRIAFLAPIREHGKVTREGHVMLLQEGYTIESHGKVGPDRRMWLARGFMRECAVYEFGVIL